MIRHIRIRTLALSLVPAIVLAAPAAPLAAQADILIQARAGAPPGDRFRVDSAGGFVAFGVAKEAGNSGACAPLAPTTGPGTRFMWLPCRGAMRVGRVPMGQMNWDDSNIGDFSFAGGNQVTASGNRAFAFGEQVTVSSVAGTGFGYNVTVSGLAGFGGGLNSKCTGYACTAIGYTAVAGGEGSVALGYRVTANNNYTVALGSRASNNGKTGTFVWGDHSTTDSVQNQANNEFRIRAAGGIKLRTSMAANAAPGASGNTGCDLPAGSGSWSCASSRNAKENFSDVEGEDVLAKVRDIPVTTWNYIEEGKAVRHMGPFSQDFYAAFQLGTDSTSIGMIDINGVNMAAIKALEQRTAELRAAQTTLEEKTQRLELLEQRVARLEAVLRKKLK